APGPAAIARGGRAAGPGPPASRRLAGRAGRGAGFVRSAAAGRGGSMAFPGRTGAGAELQGWRAGPGSGFGRGPGAGGSGFGTAMAGGGLASRVAAAHEESARRGRTAMNWIDRRWPAWRQAAQARAAEAVQRWRQLSRREQRALLML